MSSLGALPPRRRGVVLALLTVLALLVPVLALAGSGAADRTREVGKAVHGGRARNVLLFIGDGMGDSEITIARNYAVGAAGRLTMDRLPLTGAYTTYALQEADPSLPDYVTDSAASGTGWATGHKTSNGRISTTAGTDTDLPTILELAQARGFRTGDVSTAELTDATPGVLAAHVAARGCQGPADMASCPHDKKSAGGPGSIAEQQVDHHVDVLLGGGRQRFDQTVDNMSLEWTGELAKPYPGTGPQRCVEGQRPAEQPSLADMTTKAISLLESRAKGRRHGFFLQVEGASIDKQDHAENPCGQIGETVAFDRAIAVGLAYAKRHPDTMVGVTADHGHTSQIIEPQTATDHSPGAISTLITADGAQMVVNYATNLDGRSQSHTGTQVRIAAQGPQAANVVGVSDQTDLFSTMARALGLSS